MPERLLAGAAVIYCGLASDYDGTLARDGVVDASTLDAMKRFRQTGKRLLLVTGREVADLRRVCTCLSEFDLVVAENGAVLLFPETGEERGIAPAPPEQFVAALRAKNLKPLSIGRSVVATWTPNEDAVLKTIRELGLDWQITFNKGAVMCLPPGVNKASGLLAALEALHLSPNNVVAVGDAENDQAFLKVCGCSVAVANALQSVKDGADIVTGGERGAGVAELIDRWQNDAHALFGPLRRHQLALGVTAGSGTAVTLRDDDGTVLISGSSGVGKTKLTRLLVERLVETSYQVCIVDPEGDYGNLERFAHLGDAQRVPTLDELGSLLEAPKTSVVLNLLGDELGDRPVYFGKLLGQLGGMRASVGRPHWLVLDEAHHLSPNTGDVHNAPFPNDLAATLMITTRPSNLSVTALATVRVVIAVGETAQDTIRDFCVARSLALPELDGPPGEGEVLYWQLDEPGARLVTIGKARQAHQRHTRKYAEGRLGEDKSFYFKGPQGALNLRAFNLASFIEMARGVDDATFLFHLAQGDYSRWFREAIKDEGLAADAQTLESSREPASARRQLIEAVTRRYAAADVK